MSPSSAKRLSAAQRRQSIIETARPLFAERGPDGVTTRAVARAAGVSEALLYRHFSSKEELYGAILDDCVQRVLLRVKIIETVEPSTQTLVWAVYFSMWDIVLGWLPRDVSAQMSRLFARSLLGDGSYARSIIHCTTEHVMGKIEQCIHAGIAAKEITLPFEQAVTSYWLGFHLGIALSSLRMPEQTVVDYPMPTDTALIDQAVRHSLRGIGLTEAAVEAFYDPVLLASMAKQSMQS